MIEFLFAIFFMLALPIGVLFLMDKYKISFNDDFAIVFQLFLAIYFSLTLWFIWNDNPNYTTVSTDVIQLYPISEEGKLTTKYYKFAKNGNFILNDGEEQTYYHSSNFSEIEYTNENSITIIKYKTDDSKFPFCLFFSRDKEDDKILKLQEDK